jgi:rhodanese-related sulfurtransferase
MSNAPYLTDQEIDVMCDGLRQNAAKARYLRDLGITVKSKPNGRPLVMREHAERVLSGAAAIAANDAPATDPQKTQPNRLALVAAFGRRTA